MHESQNEFTSTTKNPILSMRTISFIAVTFEKIKLLNLRLLWEQECVVYSQLETPANLMPVVDFISLI